MNVKWGQLASPNGTTHRQVEVSDTPDQALFDALAADLSASLDGRWSARVDGVDQRYWDLECDSGKITLHLEHYLGISIFPTDGADATPASLTALDKAFHFLTNYNPPNNAMQTDGPSGRR